MATRRRRILRVSLVVVLLALGALVVLRNYDDLPMRIVGIAAFAFLGYVFWRDMNWTPGK